jgi:hypothetical protein
MSFLFYLATMSALPFVFVFILMITHRFGLGPQPIVQGALEPVPSVPHWAHQREIA